MFGDQNAGNFQIYNKNLINLPKTNPIPSKYRIKRPFTMISDTNNLNNDFSNSNKKFKYFNDSAFISEPKKIPSYNLASKPYFNSQFDNNEAPINIINNNTPSFTRSSSELKRYSFINYLEIIWIN